MDALTADRTMTAPHAHAPEPPPPALEAHRLTVQLGGRTVLREVSLGVETGWTAIVGPNGAGKSTLLRTLAGLLEPEGHGQVRLFGQDLRQLPEPTRARLRSWLPQHEAVSGDLTVRETVGLGRLPHVGWWAALGPEDERAIDEALARTDCLAWQHRPLGALSGGERQRVHLARALASGSPVLLLDEPTTHLDPPHQWALARLLDELAADHTVVTVLHDISLALQASRLVVIEAGHVRAQGRRDDPTLHAAIEDVFEQRLRILPLPEPGTYAALPAPWR